MNLWQPVPHPLLMTLLTARDAHTHMTHDSLAARASPCFQHACCMGPYRCCAVLCCSFRGLRIHLETALGACTHQSSPGCSLCQSSSKGGSGKKTSSLTHLITCLALSVTLHHHPLGVGYDRSSFCACGSPRPAASLTDWAA